MMSNHVKKQHFVPQFLLNYFASDNSLIWYYDKKWDKIEQKGIGGVAFEEYFYDKYTGRKEGSLEYSFQKIETLSAPIIQKIINSKDLGILTPDEKVVLTIFISLQLNRTKTALKDTERMRKYFISPIRIFAKEMNAKFDFEETPIKEFWLSTFDDTPEFSKILLNKRWTLLESENQFYTSDHPVVKGNYINGHKSPYRGILGLNSDGIEIHFPLNPSLILLLLCERTYGASSIKITKCKPENIEYVNHLQVNNADRFIFASQNDFWLAQDMMKKV